jgi:ribose transport system ATP-binding protein
MTGPAGSPEPYRPASTISGTGPWRPVGAGLTATLVSKRYGGVQALDRAELDVVPGEIHAILGENGAGKSTLVKIIAGIVPLDEGEVRAGGLVLGLGSPHSARDAGIAVVYQELSLIPQLSVAHNLFLARLPRRAGLISMKQVNRKATEALANLSLDDVDPRRPVADLPLDHQQMIEIVKATMVRPKILILDEATSSLGSAEVERLFKLVRALRDSGTTVVLITHRMREVWALADTMTIFRDGRTVGRSQVGGITQREAISLMAGRDVKTIFPEKRGSPHAAVALELRDVRLRPDRAPWSLELRRGEILGLGGLEGQGQRELLTWLYGSGKGSGAIMRDARPLRIRHPADALRRGIVLIPEDRKAEGLHLELPVRWNLAMATLPQRSRFGLIEMRAERAFAGQKIEELMIKVSSPFQPASALSGGTQQKVVIGKFMARQPSVLLFVDPTRGIDVQTKFTFYQMIRDLARNGAACVVYSSDTEELVGLCDRVAVFHDGVPVGILEGDEVTQDAVVAASFAVAREGTR